MKTSRNKDQPTLGNAGQKPFLPDQLYFESGGFEAKCHRIEFKEGKLRYCSAEGAYLYGRVVEMSPGPEKWDRFWQMVAAARVWQWELRYDNQQILDGIQWDLRIQYQGQSIRTSGSNAYPGSPNPGYPRTCAFGQFVKALQELTGRRFN